MSNEPVQANLSETQRWRGFMNNRVAGNPDDSLKASHLQTNGNIGENGNSPLKYYRGEKMKKDYSKRLNLRTADRKAPKDTSYHEIPHDHIAYRYEVLRSLGKGSFGNVILAIDHKEGTEVAVKVVRGDIRFTTQAKEEIAILERLQQLNPNPMGSNDRFPIVRMIEHFMFRDHMCLSFELLGCSLYDLIKDKKDQGLPRDRVRRLMSSVLDGLIYVWNAGIIHCDLKPENVLLVSRASDGGPDDIRDLVKIIDFGSSCFIGKQCYPYIQSRFYRAPEVILRLDYSQPIDMWSFGCLVFEMIRGYPLFPGEDEFDQLACMMEKLGMPPWSMVGPSRVFKRYFTEAEPMRKCYNPLDKQTPLSFIPRYCFIHNNQDGTSELRPNLSKKTRRFRKPPGAVPVSQALVSTLSHSSGKYKDYIPTPSEELDNLHVVKLIEACLCWPPDNRITPEQAKTFSWFSYKVPATNGNQPVSLLTRSRSPRSQNSTRKEVAAPATARNGLPNNLAVPIVAAPASVVRDMPRTPPRIMKAPTSTTSSGGTSTSHPGEGAVTSKLKPSIISMSPPNPEPGQRHGSRASISPTEERIIYPSNYKSSSPKVLPQGRDFRSLEKKTSGLSLNSSIEDSGPTVPQETARYARRNGPHTHDRFQEPAIRQRKRNQSVEPKRYTQPVHSELLPKDHNVLPSRSFVENSSPEEESQKSGRCNPKAFSKNSQWDLTAIGQNEPRNTSYENRSYAARARRRIPDSSDVHTLERRLEMAKTRSVIDFPVSLQPDVFDGSDVLRNNALYDFSLRTAGQNRGNANSNNGLKETYVDIDARNRWNGATGGGNSNVNGFTKVPPRMNLRVMHPHSDLRRRRTTHAGELTEAKLSSSQPVKSNPIARRIVLDDDSPKPDRFMDNINNPQHTTMMIKPQT